MFTLSECELIIRALGELPAKNTFNLIVKVANLAEELKEAAKNNEKVTDSITAHKKTDDA